MKKQLDEDFAIDLTDQRQQANKLNSNVKGQFNSTQNPKENLLDKNAEQMGIKKDNYDLSQAAHPFACIFTFIFKAIAFIIYFFGGFVFSNTLIFIVVVLLSAIDFWTVKNVTGRLLVGLRWWSDFDNEGKQIWKFQSYDKEFLTNSVDTAIFWTSQAVGTLVWIVFLILKVLSLQPYWALLVFINLSLTGMNLWGYYKCRGQHSKKISKFKQQFAKQGIMHVAKNYF